MSSSISAILAILFIFATLVSSRIHQTSDSIIIEGNLSEFLILNGQYRQ